jgi:protein subunit release factor A
MNKTLIEIRAAEGGQDSKLLVEDMAGIYQKACSINNFTCDVKQ